ncbi:hypothetical protein BGW39_001453 [Mortierella sp. 14UC]|nr:hypothetical protein BGW39_001453 [Mortierella sp. 14UC]
MLATNSINGASKASSASARTLNQTEHHPPAPLPRLVAVNSTNNSNSNNTNTHRAQRTRSLRNTKNKPLTITTQNSAGSGTIAQMQVGTGANGGNGQDAHTPVRTPRSGSVRRKPVAVVPCLPVGASTNVAKPLKSRIHSDIAAATAKERAFRVNNSDHEMIDKSYSAVPTTNITNTTIKRGSSTQSSVNGSEESLSSSRSIGSAHGGGGSKRNISSGSPWSKSGVNMGQRFGEFLAISGSLLGSKKRGSYISIKSASRSSSESVLSSSSSSISSLTKEASGSSISSEDDRDDAVFEKELLGIIDIAQGSQELNKAAPTSDYEDEAFGLWIRPNHEARTIISGADVEKAEKEDAHGGSGGRNTYNYPNAGAQKKNRPELEDMEVLEEVHDFSIIILMRASARLYLFIASAHSKSVPFHILWRSLQYKERGFRHHNIRTLEDYQDYVMADIGCAIQAMNEIYDQQDRPLGHPDDLTRDIKPRPGARSPPVVMPPSRITQNNNINSSSIGGSKGSSRQGSPMHQINTTQGVPYSNGSSLYI